MMNDTISHILHRPGVDRVFDSLADRRRRLILLLLKHGRVETTADLLFRGENETDEAKITLEHCHLPRLEDAGYIKWDRETDEVSKGPRYDEIEPILELIETHADELPPSWP